MNDKEILAGIEAFSANNEALCIKTGVVPVDGGFNAVIVLDDGTGIQFSQPLFKSKQKAMRYAKIKAGDAIQHLAEQVKRFGYGIEVSSK
jgi:hypothetical protein